MWETWSPHGKGKEKLHVMLYRQVNSNDYYKP